MASGTKFLDIPTEVSQMIYKELFNGVIIGHSASSCCDSGIFLSQNVLAAIFETCHTCYDEARPIFLATVCFKGTGYDLVPDYNGKLTSPSPDSVLFLPANLTETDRRHVRHLQIPTSIRQKADLPTLFPNLKSLTIIADSWDCINVVGLPQEGIIDLLRNNLLNEYCAERVRAQLCCIVEPEVAEGYQSFVIGRRACTTARIMHREWNESNKCYKIFQHVTVYVDLTLMDGDCVGDLDFFYDMDTGTAKFNERALCAWIEEVKISLPEGALSTAVSTEAVLSPDVEDE